MSFQPTISVALAVLNGAEFLEPQLESILAQTRQPDELVACDDGSSDGTLALLAEFADRAPFPVRIHRNDERLGYPDNFLKAAQLCRGDFIAYTDDDDVWSAPKLERLLSAIRDRSRPAIVAHSYDVVDSQLRPIGRGPIQRTRRLLPERVPLFDSFNGSSMLFRRSLLRLARDHHRRPGDVHAGRPMSHDKWVIFLSSLEGGLLLIPDILSVYRQHGSNEAGASGRGLTAHLGRTAAADYHHYRRMAHLARERTAALGEIAEGEDVSPDAAARAIARASVFARYAHAAAQRANLYRPEQPRAARMRCLGALALGGGYRRQRFGGLGPRAIGKDLAVSVTGPDRVQRALAARL